MKQKVKQNGDQKPRSRIKDHDQSIDKIKNQESRIKDQESRIKDQGSRIKDQG